MCISLGRESALRPTAATAATARKPELQTATDAPGTARNPERQMATTTTVEPGARNPEWQTVPRKRIFFLRLFRAAAVFNFLQVPDLACLGYRLWLGIWVGFTIIVSLALTLTLITTLTVILP